ncbi:hypothetical protein BO85DRAFT_447116 [Aspergillus piperis CBS 112811]|uniref:Uncharacterized protein n=1 Tax=Aspergillus piperis CBS 112811 TaxID=1448313 RepID=A0A8G1R5N7_9EURO|nr:hypothetical protein BO85DRAFT_447116 [Aspergillus piperis CBS 112811]RAH60551.1 hypothetical protein BO85DRAFT_447116 [Aspergillus piperis CBS 112811]
MAQVHLPLLAKAHEMAASSCLRVDPMDLVSYPIGSSVKAPYDDSIQIPDRLMWNHDEQKCQTISLLFSFQRPPL